ncbi:MAG: PKD domain-containing protein [Bacteroidetes bacterium]|nr:MAG: PKD domain-containing protein [Bacteroidota bacterium]
MKVFSTVTGKFTRLAFGALLAFLLGQQEARSQFCNSSFTYTINQAQGLIYFTPNDMDTLATHFWNLAGIGSTLRQPTRALFTAPGTYRIMHQISKSGCIPDSSEQFITINATCNANFNYTVNNTTLQVTFVSVDTLPNATHSWIFGGQGSSALPTLLKQFSSAGTYFITHIVTRGTCSDTVSKWVTVGNQPCLANFTHTVDSLGAVHFTNTATPSSNNPPHPLNYSWSFGDGSTSTQKNPTYNYPVSGWYIVCLMVAKPDSSCTNTFCDTIYRGPVNPPPTTCLPDFSFATDNGNPKKINFTNTSSFDTLSRLPLLFIWTFGDGDSAVGYHQSHTYTQAGTYQVCLIIKRGTACQNTKCKTVTVQSSGTCQAGFTYLTDSLGVVRFANTSTPSSNNPPHPLNYFWTFGDGTTSTQKNPTHNYSANGWYYVCLKVTKPDTSCTNMFCDTIYRGPINNSTCNANFDFIVDNSDPKKIHFTNTSTFDSLTRLPILSIWSFGDGDSAAGFNLSHTYVTAGNYQVCLTVKQGNCQHTTCKTISVQPSLGCHASFTYTLYPDTIDGTKRIVMFNNTSTSNAGILFSQWSFGDSTWSTTSSPTHYYPVNGMYTVCLSIAGGDSCLDDTCVTIAIMPDSSTGLKNVSGLEHIRYYPVPMDGMLYLDLSPENKLDYQITISNTLGVPVIQTQGKAEQRQVAVDVAELPAGIYLITLSNKLGSVTKRLMK